MVVGDPKAAVSVSLSLGPPSGRSTNPGRPGLANPNHFCSRFGLIYSSTHTSPCITTATMVEAMEHSDTAVMVMEAVAEATEETEAITKAGEHFRTSISFELVVSNDHPSHMK